MKQILIIAAFLISFVPTSFSQEIQMSGNIGYSISLSDTTIELTVGKISNNRDEGTSGTLGLMLFFTENRYSEGEIYGYLVAEYEFDDILKAGYYLYDVKQTVTFKYPPDDNYYVTFVLVEWSGSEYETLDYYTFNDLINFFEE